jgi:hypothetical protein
MPARLLLSHAMEQAIALSFDDNSAHTGSLVCYRLPGSSPARAWKVWFSGNLPGGEAQPGNLPIIPFCRGVLSLQRVGHQRPMATWAESRPYSRLSLGDASRVFAAPNRVNTSLCLSMKHGSLSSWVHLNTFRSLRTPSFCVPDLRSEGSWND